VDVAVDSVVEGTRRPRGERGQTMRVAYPVSIDILGVVVSSFSLEAKATPRSQ
jgi:hypothetical protein